MISPYAIAANFACLLYLARHRPEAEAELAEGIRVFRASLGDGPVAIEATMGWLSIAGHRLPTGSPGTREVNEQLLSHSVSRVTIPPASEAGDLRSLVRTLAAYPGQFGTWEDLIASLGPVADRIALTRAGVDLPFIRVEETEPVVALESRGSDLLASMREPGQAQRSDEGSLVPPPMEVRPPAPAPLEPASPRKSEDPKILESLIVQGRSAADAGDYLALLRVARGFLDAEDRTRSEAAGRLYRLELRRLLTRRHLSQFARLAAVGEHRELAVGVLNRIGPDATEVLMEQLVEAESMAERRGYYSALMRMDDGTEIIVHHLEHPTWYVARNAAELTGEMGLVKAVPQLARLVTHADERVRKSVATALNRIGTPETAEPLGRMLKDPSPVIRQQVLGGLDGARARPLAMPLAALLESEEHPEVLREVLRALGRIGTPDALLALRQAALGEFGRLGRRHRVQAVEAMAQAGSASRSMLQSLAQDPDPEVSAAASRAVERLAS